MSRPKLKSNHTKPLQAQKQQKSIRRQQMERILTVWERFPELRLGQLLGNATNKLDIYYVPDEDLVAAVVKYHAPEEQSPTSLLKNERNTECC